jgi:flagellar protein FlgJ
MTRITSSAAPAAQPARDDERLRGVARQLEGVFVQQLFKAMRETVPTDGIANGGAGEEIFTSLMDERIAGDVPSHWDRGIGESLYRQLRAALPPADPSPADAGADEKRIK